MEKSLNLTLQFFLSPAFEKSLSSMSVDQVSAVEEVIIAQVTILVSELKSAFDKTSAGRFFYKI
jgi:hypothetical protein